MTRQVHLADTLGDALKAYFGSERKLVPIQGWETRGRSTFFPVGIVEHHTGSSSAIIPVLRDGRSDLPGPLCHWSVQKSGDVFLYAAGRANHAGRPWTTSQDRAGVGNPLRRFGATGNSHVYGSESINLGNGRDLWTPAQLETIAVVDAAITAYHGWPEQSARVCDHKEWAGGRKIDCRFGAPDITFEAVRKMIDVRLERPSGGDDMDAKRFEMLARLADPATIVESYYVVLLGRGPEATALKFWVGWLAKPGNTVEAFWNALEAGDEHARYVERMGGVAA